MPIQFHGRSQQWMARGVRKKSGKPFTIGYYDTEAEAASVLEQWAAGRLATPRRRNRRKAGAA